MLPQPLQHPLHDLKTIPTELLEQAFQCIAFDLPPPPELTGLSDLTWGVISTLLEQLMQERERSVIH